jgi:hypothetical protein
MTKRIRYVLSGKKEDASDTSDENRRAFFSIDWRVLGYLFEPTGEKIPVLDYARGATGVTGKAGPHLHGGVGKSHVPRSR